MPSLPVVMRATLARMSPVDLYGVLRVRQDVFIVEQNCPYPDIDGIDLGESTEQLWISEGDHVVATMRVYPGDGAMHIGRVATHPGARGRGYSSLLLDASIERCRERRPDLPIEIGAQAYLENWYARFGFERAGEDYLEDGIRHLPMRLAHGNSTRSVGGKRLV